MATRPRPFGCSCVHSGDEHDPVTGACLRVAPTMGPCCCDATPLETREALHEAWLGTKAALEEQDLVLAERRRVR